MRSAVRQTIRSQRYIKLRTSASDERASAVRISTEVGILVTQQAAGILAEAARRESIVVAVVGNSCIVYEREREGVCISRRVASVMCEVLAPFADRAGKPGCCGSSH